MLTIDRGALITGTQQQKLKNNNNNNKSNRCNWLGKQSAGGSQRKSYPICDSEFLEFRSRDAIGQFGCFRRLISWWLMGWTGRWAITWNECSNPGITSVVLRRHVMDLRSITKRILQVQKEIKSKRFLGLSLFLVGSLRPSTSGSHTLLNLRGFKMRFLSLRWSES